MKFIFNEFLRVFPIKTSWSIAQQVQQPGTQRASFNESYFDELQSDSWFGENANDFFINLNKWMQKALSYRRICNHSFSCLHFLSTPDSHKTSPENSNTNTRMNLRATEQRGA